MENTTETRIEFPPISGYDASEIPPVAPAGQWVGLFSVVKKSLAKDKQNGDVPSFPMLTLKVKLESAEDADNESYVGAELNEWLIIYPNGHKNQRQAKEKMEAVAAALGFATKDVIPRSITSLDDLNDLVAAIDGQRAAVWTWIKEDKNTHEKVTQLAFAAPKSRRS